jgi:hypothetical protein
VLPFVPKDKEVLPKAFRWFDNADAHVVHWKPVPDGLCGDIPYRVRRAEQGHTNLFWERYYWLALRNPMNYFSVKYLGLPYVENFRIFGNTETSDQGESGYVFKEGFSDHDALTSIPCVHSKSNCAEFYYVKAYKLFGKDLCIRFRVGHKLPHTLKGVLIHAGFVFTFNPFMPYRPGGFNK